MPVLVRRIVNVIRPFAATVVAFTVLREVDRSGSKVVMLKLALACPPPLVCVKYAVLVIAAPDETLAATTAGRVSVTALLPVIVRVVSRFVPITPEGSVSVMRTLSVSVTAGIAYDDGVRDRIAGQGGVVRQGHVFGDA